MSYQGTIAFVGATGGCAAAALALTLKAGFKATALARTPSKLTSLLTESHNLPLNLLPNLAITQGSISDPSALLSVLAPSTSPPVTHIIFALGATPVMTYHPLHPVTISDPHICATGMRAVLAALHTLQAQGRLQTKPQLLAISTTGVTRGKRDVPTALYPLYHYMLAVPHKDKREMEEVVMGDEMAGVLRGWTVVRPTLLFDGEAVGRENVRVGWEWGERVPFGERVGQAPGPELGYQVKRNDVGGWVFEQFVRGGGEWRGKCVTLTS